MCCLGALGISPPIVYAQLPRLKPGAQIRLDAPSAGGQLRGTLIALEPDTLVMAEAGQPAGLRLIILTDSIARLEVQRERSLAPEGAVLGFLGGTLLALVASPDCVNEDGESQTLLCLAYKVSPHLDTRITVLGGLGALVGVIAGSDTKKRWWIPVPLNGGCALGLSISF
jgi:hypothetical protein